MTRLAMGRVMQGHVVLRRCGAPGPAVFLAVVGAAANVLTRRRTLEKSKNAASKG